MARAQPRRLAQPRWRGSVRWRMTAVVMVVFGLTLALAGILFVNRVEASLVDKIKEADKAELERVSGFFKSGEPVPSVLPPLPNRPSSQMQALGPNGEVIAATPGLQGQGPVVVPQRPRNNPPRRANAQPFVKPGEQAPPSSPVTAPPVSSPPGQPNPKPDPGRVPAAPMGDPKGDQAGSDSSRVPTPQPRGPVSQPSPQEPAGRAPSSDGSPAPGPSGPGVQSPLTSVPQQGSPAPASPVSAPTSPVSSPPASPVQRASQPTAPSTQPPVSVGAPAESPQASLSPEPSVAPQQDLATTPSASVSPTSTTSPPGQGTKPDGDFALTQLPVSTRDGSVDLVAVSPLADVKASVDALSRFLWVAIPLLVLLIGATAWFLTGQALQPVAAMAQQVDDITASTLHERVSVPAADDEFAHLARTMNGMLERLESASSRQKQFVSDASHELRSPVASIRTELEVALLHPGATDWQEVGRNVLVEDERLERIVNDLLTLARLDEQVDLGKAVDVDLDEIVRAEAARTRRLPVDVSDPAPVRLSGRPDELGRMVGHLLDNAARHGRSGVRVEVGHESNGTAHVFVDDDGPGVPLEQREAVFERFGRLQEGRSRDSGGAGLGLAVVKRIAERHGGSVEVTTSPLGGARFAMTFPVASERPGALPRQLLLHDQ